MENSVKSSAIQYGLYLGLMLSSFTIIGYAVNIEILTKWWLGIILFILIIVIGIVSTAKAKSILNGFISFKEAFTAWFTTIVVGILISTVVSILIFNVVDLEAAALVKQASIEATVSMMENFGTPQETIDMAITEMENTNQFAIGNLLKSLAWQFLFYAIVGLLIALIMKKTDPDAA
jgi:phenylpyruvate tautomerase PptA (4-oxalocrotonate tautomerase family)